MFEKELIKAAQEGDNEKIKEWLAKGADVNFKSAEHSNKTALHIIMEHGDHRDAALTLLDAGANIEALDGWNNNALYCAAFFGRLEVTQLLLERGANRNHVQSKDGPTAAQLATNFGFHEVAKLITSYGSKPSSATAAAPVSASTSATASASESKQTSSTTNPALLAVLSRIASNDSTLKKVDLREKNLTSEDIIILASALKNNTFVIEFDLTGNRVGVEGAKALAEVLKINKSITTLRLHNSQLGNEGVIALAKAVKINSSLTWLGLGSNKVGESGTKAVAEMLETNKSLMLIDLGDNQIKDADVKVLIEALKTNNSIATVGLGVNQIGDEGAIALAEMLKTNNFITEVVLISNRIGMTGGNALLETLKTNKSVISLNLHDNNQMGGAIHHQILALLASNQLLAKPYQEAKEAHSKALSLIQENATSEDIQKAFSTAKAKAEEGIQKGYLPSQHLLVRIAHDLKRYQETQSSSSQVTASTSASALPTTDSSSYENKREDGTTTTSFELQDQTTKIFNAEKLLKQIHQEKTTVLNLSLYRTYEENGKFKCDQSLNAHDRWVYPLVVLPGGLLATGGLDRKIKLWDMKNNSCVATFDEEDGHKDAIRAFAVLPDGRLASGSFDGTIKIWNIVKRKCVATLTGHNKWILALVVSPDGRLVSGSADCTIRFWDTENYTCVHTITEHQGFVRTLAIQPNTDLVSGSDDHTIKVWDSAEKNCKLTLTGHTDSISALAVFSDQYIASSSFDKNIKFWDLKSGKCVHTTAHKGSGYSLTVLPNGHLASDLDKNVAFTLPGTETIVHITTFGEQYQIENIVSLPDGGIVSSSPDGTVKIWHAPTRALNLTDLRLLFTKLENYPFLKSINLQHMLLKDTDVPELIRCLQFNKQPTQLDVRNTQITVNGVQKIHEIFPSLQIQYGAAPSTPPSTIPSPEVVPPSQPAHSTHETSPPVTAETKEVTHHLVQVIPWQSLTIEKHIANGSFGDVYRGRWLSVDVAIKQLHLKTIPERLTKDFNNEVRVMTLCRHPNIVMFYGVCIDPGHSALVMELLAKGSLYDILHDKRIELPWSLRLHMAKGIGRGLHYLHSNHILHRDLKSLNVIVGADNTPKISDFGLATIKLETNTTTAQAPNAVGTVRWRAPELFKRGFKYTWAADVYSFGMILGEIASRELPFKEATDDATVISFIKDLKEGDHEEIPADCPPAYAELVKSCVSLKPEGRPSTAVILSALENIKLNAEAKTVPPDATLEVTTLLNQLRVAVADGFKQQSVHFSHVEQKLDVAAVRQTQLHEEQREMISTLTSKLEQQAKAQKTEWETFTDTYRAQSQLLQDIRQLATTQTAELQKLDAASIQRGEKIQKILAENLAASLQEQQAHAQAQQAALLKLQTSISEHNKESTTQHNEAVEGLKKLLASEQSTLKQNEATLQELQTLIATAKSVIPSSQETSREKRFEHPKVQNFYVRLKEFLEEYYIHANLIVKGQEKPSHATIDAIKDKAKTLTDFIPVPYLGLVVDLFTAAAKAVDTHHQAKNANLALELTQGPGYFSIAEVAYQVAFKYQRQISLLTPEDIEKLASVAFRRLCLFTEVIVQEAYDDKSNKKLEEKQVEHFKQTRGWEKLLAPGRTLVELLSYGVAIEHHSKIKRSWKSTALTTTDPHHRMEWTKDWTAEGLFKRTAVALLEDGTQYILPGGDKLASKQGKYGHRYITKDEMRFIEARIQRQYQKTATQKKDVLGDIASPPLADLYPYKTSLSHQSSSTSAQLLSADGLDEHGVFASSIPRTTPRATVENPKNTTDPAIHFEESSQESYVP